MLIYPQLLTAVPTGPSALPLFVIYAIRQTADHAGLMAQLKPSTTANAFLAAEPTRPSSPLPTPLLVATVLAALALDAMVAKLEHPGSGLQAQVLCLEAT